MPGSGSFGVVLRVFLPFALGYYLSYLYRVVNAVLAPDLTHDLGLSAEDLGLLTASYFISFAAFQLPLGVLLDRFGPARVEAILLIFASAGAFIFAKADSLGGLVIGRALIGFGVSACLMAAFKAFTVWFDPQRLPAVNGTIMAAGGLGALSATAPVEAALQVTDWRGVFMVLAGVTLIGSLCVGFLVPSSKTAHPAQGLKDQLLGIKQVFTNRTFWTIAPITMLSQSSFISIQSLWAGPWLRDVAGMERGAAANLLFFVALAMVCGFLGLGALAERLSRHHIPVSVTAGGGIFIFMLVQLGILSGFLSLAPALWVAFGFFGTTGIIQYAALSQAFPSHLAGRVNTAINLLVFICAFVFQSTTGAIIDLWPRSPSGTYAAEGFQAAFGLLLGLQAIAFVWFVINSRRS